ncbi:single-stranded-DNA-specific exonuclease RecJ [Olivibacter sitiensis]|uniref:single-stranded-DNA-specific exonuclease RecJ n=1 Tax=Olivibacter sitiensis TaxID=376470 RepID=UPI0003FA2892|nr:single-stranded-DNA-specific exonuclease RecJ [Olivibacter sitiensis]
MEKRWVEQPKGNKKVISRLAQELNIDPVLSTVLVQRGVTDFESAKAFFRPSLQDLHDPFLMRDMDLAIGRIDKAIGNKETVLIYGDYDVDGTTAVALLYMFLRNYHSQILYYVPDRYKEGYGISHQGIDFAEENGCSLIIALDCGIKSLEEVDYAKSKGIDFIIGDHHMPGEGLPNAVAVLDPKRADCSYPFKELSGCGIGFKVIQAFVKANGLQDSEAYQYLDLVAVSIASDIVPVLGENRVLAYFGLQKLNQNPCCGLKALIDVASKKENLTLNDIIFQIGPRINAAGRIHHAKGAVQLLTAKTLAEATSFCEVVDGQNTERKDVDMRITAQALDKIRKDQSLINRKTTVVYQEDWHKGVIGIVASRLTETFYRPTIVLTRSNGHVSGSARSVVGFDLYEALCECQDLFEQFGGHKYAAGLTMSVENVPALQQRFEEVVSQRITPELLKPEILIESTLRLKSITGKFVRIMRQFAPHGPENPMPIFVSKQVFAVGAAMIVGINHVKMYIQQEDSPVFPCIGFGLAEHIDGINKGLPFDICYTIEENVWREKRTLQLHVKSLRFYR